MIVASTNRGGGEATHKEVTHNQCKDEGTGPGPWAVSPHRITSTQRGSKPQ